MHGLPDDTAIDQRAFYPPNIVHIHAAYERVRHRRALQDELDKVRRQLVQAEAQADRLRLIQQGIERQLAGAAP